MRGMLLNCGFGQQAVTRHALERGEEDFSGPSYFASHNPVKFRRKQDRRKHRQRELTPEQATIFHAAMAMIGNGRSVDEAVAWAKAKSKK